MNLRDKTMDVAGETLKKAAGNEKLYYERAKAYYEEHGDLCVPEKYVTEDGYALGNWVKLQRGVKKGTQRAGISYDSNRIKLMDEIGMVWNAQRIHTWDEYVAALVEFKIKHGHMCLPRTYMVGDMCVSNWVKLQRTLRNQGELSQDKIDALDAIGFPWDYPLEEWRKSYIDAKAYYDEFGNMEIPKGYKGKAGTSLKLWWDRQRRNMNQKPESFSDEQIRLLLDLGLDCPGQKKQEIWERHYQELVEYKMTHGSLQVPCRYKTKDGTILYNWIASQRKRYAKGILEIERIKKLEEIGLRLE